MDKLLKKTQYKLARNEVHPPNHEQKNHKSLTFSENMSKEIATIISTQTKTTLTYKIYKTVSSIRLISKQMVTF